MILLLKNSRLMLYCFVLVLLAQFAGIGVADAATADLSPVNQSAPSAEDEIVYLPSLFSHYTAQREQTAFGVQMYGATGYNSDFFQPLLRSNASWVRNEIYWWSTEPENTTPENYNWASIDRSLGAAGDGNFHMIATFGLNPQWAASTTNGPIDKVDISEFVEFVSAVVERYDGDGVDDRPGSPKILHYELYNEPDYESSTLDRSAWGNSPQQYAAMLKAVYPAIKAANPDAQVLFGGLAYDWFNKDGGPFVQDFLPKVLDEDVGDSFDIMSFHQYPPFAASWADQGPGLYEKTQTIRELLDSYGVSKPMVISESGMHSNNTNNLPMTEELQSRYVVQLYTQAIAADVGKLIWFSLYDPPEWYPFKNGLVTADEEPREKTSMTAYRTAVKLLKDVRPDAVLTAADTGVANMQAYRLRDDDGKRTVYVAWMNPLRTDEVARLAVPAGGAKVSDIYGKHKTVTDADDGGTGGGISVKVGSQPVYIEVFD